MTAHERRDTVRQFWIAAGLSLFAAIAFYFSTNATLRDLDYTSRIASALLSGHLGLREKPPDWLNEMIPHRDSYYSALLCWDTLQLSILPWCDRPLSSRARSSRLLLVIALSCSSPCPFILTFFGADRMKS